MGNLPVSFFKNFFTLRSHDCIELLVFRCFPSKKDVPFFFLNLSFLSHLIAYSSFIFVACEKTHLDV